MTAPASTTRASTVGASTAGASTAGASTAGASTAGASTTRASTGLRLTLRIDHAGKHMLGPGKARLLELIGQLGSISAAGRAMGMSYRRAWLLTESLNTTFATPLVTARPGGPGGGGAALTPAGRDVVRRYRSIEAAASGAALDDLSALQAALAAATETETETAAVAAAAV